MAITCEPQALLDASGCFPCLAPGQHTLLQTWLLCQILEAVGGTCDLETALADAKCFECLSPGQHQALQTYFLCQIASTV